MYYLHPFCKAVEFRGDFPPHACVRCSSRNELLLMPRNIFGLNAVSQGLAVKLVMGWEGFRLSVTQGLFSAISVT